MTDNRNTWAGEPVEDSNVWVNADDGRMERLEELKEQLEEADVSVHQWLWRLDLPVPLGGETQILGAHSLLVVEERIQVLEAFWEQHSCAQEVWACGSGSCPDDDHSGSCKEAARAVADVLVGEPSSDGGCYPQLQA